MLDFDGFVNVTRRIASSDEDFLPTFCDPAEEDIRVLEGVPDGVDQAEATRGWAARFGVETYYIAFPSSTGVMVEGYEHGQRTARTAIQN